MSWAHLPVAGGLYDQDPMLLDAWLVIWQAKGAEERQEAAKKKKPQGKGTPRRR